MKNMIFATVNNKEILGSAILYAKKRIVVEQEHSPTFVHTPNEDNNSFINAEALQKTIDLHALVSLAKFEGITVEEDDISKAIFELRSGYEDDISWEMALYDLGIDDKNIREIFYLDMMVDTLICSHLEHYEDPNDDTAAEFYHQNTESMSIPALYTFIEIEVPNTERVKLVATILSQEDTASIVKEAQKYNLNYTMNEEISRHLLPDPLKSVLDDLQEYKIGTLPTEDDTIILIKLLRKIPSKILSLDDSLPGLIEYLKFQQYKDVLDQLTEEAVNKCDIVYHNSKYLKDLK